MSLGVPAAAQVPTDGQWMGVDSNGDPVTFIVSGGGSQVSGFSFAGSCFAGRVLGQSPVSAGDFTFSTPMGGYCSAYWGGEGIFASAAAASGTTFTAISGGGIFPCACSKQRTWTAAFFAPGGGADLGVTDTDGRDVVSPGALTTYEIGVTNHGPDAVSSFRLAPLLPFVEPAPPWTVSGGVYDSATGLWSGSLPAGQTVTLTVAGHPASPTPPTGFESTVTVSTNGVVDPNPWNDQATDSTAVRTLAIQMSGSTRVVTPPSSIVLTITLANQGPVAAENAMVDLQAPTGLVFSGNTGACTTPFPCALGTIPSSPGAPPRTITSAYDVPSAFPDPGLFFLATATTTTPEATVAENTDHWEVTVLHPGPPARLNVVDPCRLLDTRASTPIAAAAVRNVVAAGGCGVPISARALALNVTVVSPTGDGDLRVYPGALRTLTSVINFRAGQTRANNAVVGLGAAGDLSIEAEMASGSVHVILDVSGYFE